MLLNLGGSQSSNTNKRKRQDLESEEDDVGQEEVVDEPQEEDDEEAGDEYVAPRKTKVATKPRGRPRGPPATKKPRAPKMQTKSSITRKGKRKVQGDGDAYEPAKMTLQTKLSDDNALFSTY